MSGRPFAQRADLQVQGGNRPIDIAGLAEENQFLVLPSVNLISIT